MHKSEHWANLILITHADKVYKRRPLETIGVLTPLESNSKINLRSHYRELIEFQYPM